jgi:predicted ArsR family transcriptional regulator
MQSTRRLILEILRARGQATVEDIVAELRKRRGSITAVTVRHHLMRLQEEALITSPELRRRSSPGRPQHVYALTDKANEIFPNNYQRLAEALLLQIQKQLPPDGVNVIIEGVAAQFAADADLNDMPLPEKLDAVAAYLNLQGYDAHWETCDGGYMLHTSNCPYHHTAQGTEALCEMDMRMIAQLIGVVPRRAGQISHGDRTCAYFIPE